MKRKDYKFLLPLRHAVHCSLLTMLFLMSACSNEDVAPTVTDDHVRISLRSLVPLRDFTYNPDWFKYTDVPTLGVYDYYGEGSNQTLAIENSKLEVGKTSTDWAYSGDDTKTYSYDMLYRGRNHHLFAYGPYASKDSVSFDGNLFTWKNIPLISLTDKVIANKIVSLSKGVAVLQMNHLYARVDVNFSINEKYAKLRTIEITNVSIEGLPSLDADGGKGTYTYNFEENKPVWHDLNIVKQTKSFAWAASETNKYFLPYKESEEGEEKYKKELQTFYLAPGLYNVETLDGFKMKVTYNVYDKKGQETRHQQTISNDILIANYHKGDNGTDPFSTGGYLYSINVNIAPKYLYVLSDNDTESAFNVNLPIDD